MKRYLDFTAYAAECSMKSDAELAGAARDIRETLPTADENDRGGGGEGVGGYYRDQLAVIRSECNRRLKLAKASR